MSWRLVAIDRGDVGVRLDLVLLRHLGHEPGVSRARIQRWIASGRVTVNGAAAPRVAWRVAEGDDVRLDAREIRGRTRPQPENIALEVLFEDDHLLALNKPAGIVVHPSYKHASGTLINALLWRAERWPSGDKPALLTRLDKMTSGVLLVAKRTAVVAALQREMRAERIEKDYLAVVLGRPPMRATIDLALDRDPWDRRRVTVTDRGGQRAVTKLIRLATSRLPEGDWDRYAAQNENFVPVVDPHSGPRRAERAEETTEPAKGSGGREIKGRALGLVSLVQCRLVTGRMHQIRVHLAYKGWPLVGDQVYGRAVPEAAFNRQALHAWRVALKHPVTGEALAIEAPLPEDLARLLEQLGLSGPV
jgi:23S rRNA pseudouridine1911/1915/1917 synthase